MALKKKTAKKSAKKTVIAKKMASSKPLPKTSKKEVQAQKLAATKFQSGPMIRSFISPKQTGPIPLRILWIPGLGGDRAMFAKIIDHITAICLHPVRHSFLEYPNVGVGEVDSLESLASLLSQAILPDEPYDMVIGYSMGGMVLQILRMKGSLHAETFVVIASGYSGKHTTTFLNGFGAFTLSKVPIFARSFIQKMLARLYPVLRMNISDSKEYGAMINRSCKTVFFEGGSWVRKWQGVPEPFYSDCLSVHGNCDPIMSYAKVAKTKKPDLTIEKGSHILFATHSKEIADFLLPALNQLAKAHT